MRAGTWIATVGGLGFSPIAPGTVGTLAAVPVARALARLNRRKYLALCAALGALGTWAAGQAEAEFGAHDSSAIVIDEVVGYLVAVAGVDRSDWRRLLAGFLLFRWFDIRKPGPIGWIDRNAHGAFGVMADDIAAGAMTALCLALKS